MASIAKACSAIVIAISVTNSRGPMPRVACAEWVTVEVEDMD